MRAEPPCLFTTTQVIIAFAQWKTSFFLESSLLSVSIFLPFLSCFFLSHLGAKIRDPIEIGLPPLSVDVSGTSKHMAVSTGAELQVWDLKAKKRTFTVTCVGEREREKRGEREKERGGEFCCVRFHSSSRHLAGGDTEGKLHLVNLTTNQVTPISSSSSSTSSWPIRHVEFSSVQKVLVASVSDAGMVDVWDTTRISSSSSAKRGGGGSDGLLLHEGLHRSPATSASFHPTERFTFSSSLPYTCDVRMHDV